MGKSISCLLFIGILIGTTSMRGHAEEIDGSESRKFLKHSFPKSIAKDAELSVEVERQGRRGLNPIARLTLRQKVSGYRILVEFLGKEGQIIPLAGTSYRIDKIFYDEKWRRDRSKNKSSEDDKERVVVMGDFPSDYVILTGIPESPFFAESSEKIFLPKDPGSISFLDLPYNECRVKLSLTKVIGTNLDSAIGEIEWKIEDGGLDRCPLQASKNATGDSLSIHHLRIKKGKTFEIPAIGSLNVERILKESKNTPALIMLSSGQR